MHIEQVRFDEIFDVQAGRGQLRGDFSFRSGHKPCYGVNLGGFIPAAGTCYLVAFERPGDWTSALAWRAPGAREVRFRQAGWLALSATLVDVLLFSPFVVAGGILLAGGWGALVLAIAYLALVATGVALGVRRKRRIERALLAVGTAPATRGNAGTAGAGACV